jgi:S-(hydroxymethyl)glutathione dehydrogenase/alcohol dehydrogenase
LKTKAAVIRGIAQDWEITELGLDPPKARPGDTTIVCGVGGVGHERRAGRGLRGRAPCHRGGPGGRQAEAGQGIRRHRTATAAEVVAAAFAAIRKRGTVVVTALGGLGASTSALPGLELTLFEKRIQGALFGSGNPFEEIPRMLDPYRDGRLKLDELVTTRYRLDEVNQGYQDLRDGKNIRGLIVHEP